MVQFPTFSIPLDSARQIVQGQKDTAAQDTKITVSGEASVLSMVDIGITYEMYKKLQKVCADHHCIIMIRKTNKGSVLPFEQGIAVGKKLATKGKSSNAHFTKGNIAFLAQLAKSLDSKEWLKQQATLIGVLEEKASNGTDPKYAYIPKLLTVNQVRELLAIEGVRSAGRFEDQEITVTVPKDDVSGNRIPLEYKLLKTSWEALNTPQAEFKDKLIKPGEGDLYRVYVKIPITQPFPLFFRYEKDTDITEVEEDDLKPGHNIVQENGITIIQKDGKRIFRFPFNQVMAKELWKLKKGFPADTATEGLLEKCAPKLSPDGPLSSYREVRVLALFTHGGKSEQAGGASGQTVQGAGQNKKFFEVVADYDLFMVSPDLSSGAFKFSENDITYPTTIKKKLVSDTGAKIGEREVKTELSLLPKAGSKRIMEGGKEKNINPYGLLSDYEMFIRREVNRALDIKVAQHGIETCNLFYTSDIADPVLVIFPDIEMNKPQIVQSASIQGRPSSASTARILRPVINYDFRRDENTVSTGPCFFASFQMLFEMMTSLYGRLDRVIPDTAELNKTFGIDPRYTVQEAGDLFTNKYPMIFNLNWGTADYKKFHKIDDRKQNEINARVLPRIAPLAGELNGRFGALFANRNFNIVTKPLSLQALYLYLYQSHTIMSAYPRYLDQERNREKILKFLRLFYKQVHAYLSTPKQAGNPDWEGLLGAAGKHEEKIVSIREVYGEAVSAIEKTLQYAATIAEAAKSSPAVPPQRPPTATSPVVPPQRPPTARAGIRLNPMPTPTT